MNELWSKATDAAEEALLLYEAEHFDGACSRAYYAMFNAARALLVDRAQIDADQVKRHATVLRQFAFHFVQPGHFPTETARLLRRASDARRLADYDEISVSADEARDTLEAMKSFMTRAQELRVEG